MRLRIGFDCRSFEDSLTGIGSFTRNLIDAFIKYHPENDYVLFSQKAFHESLERDYSLFGNISICKTGKLLRCVFPMIWYHIFLPLKIKRYHVDYFFATKPNLPLLLSKKQKTIATVHDIVNIEFSNTMHWRNYISNRLFFYKSIKRADLIWFNSNYTKDSLIKYFPEFKEKDYYVGLSIDTSAFKKMELSTIEKRNVLKSFGVEADKVILFVGSLEPRKNLEFLLSLMPELYKYHVQLLVVGAKGWKNSSISQIVLDEKFPKESTIFCGYVSTEMLVKLYNSVNCFVSSSLNEGFGMPQLEALFCDCKVISPNNSAMKEVVSKRGTLIDGWDKDIWIKTIMQVIQDTDGLHVDLSEYDWKVIIDGFIEKIKNRNEDSN